MATSFKYNSVEWTELDGHYDHEFSGDKEVWSFSFIVNEDDYTTLGASLDTVREKLSEPFKDFEIKEGAVVFGAANQATHVRGFNCKPVVSIVNGENASAGLVKYLNFTVEVNRPADVLGNVGLFGKGLVDISCGVSIPYSNLYELNFSGLWKVIAANANSAFVNYRADLETLITTQFLNVYHPFKTWDILWNKPEYDITCKEMNFSVTYKQRPVVYVGSGGSKYILKSSSWRKILAGRIAKIPGAGAELGAGSAVITPGGSFNRTGRGGAGFAQPKPPVRYEFSAEIEIDVESLTRKQAVALYESEIRKWLKGKMNTDFGAKISYFEDEELFFDSYNSVLRVSSNAIEIKEGNLFDLTVKYQTSYDPKIIYRDRKSGKQFSKNFYANSADSVKTITIVAVSLKANIPEALFEAFFPSKLFDEKSGSGWVLGPWQDTEEVKILPRIESAPIFYEKSRVWNFTFVDNSTKTYLNGKIEDS